MYISYIYSGHISLSLSLFMYIYKYIHTDNYTCTYNILQVPPAPSSFPWPALRCWLLWDLLGRYFASPFSCCTSALCGSSTEVWGFIFEVKTSVLLSMSLSHFSPVPRSWSETHCEGVRFAVDCSARDAWSELGIVLALPSPNWLYKKTCILYKWYQIIISHYVPVDIPNVNQFYWLYHVVPSKLPQLHPCFRNGPRRVTQLGGLRFSGHEVAEPRPQLGIHQNGWLCSI